MSQLADWGKFPDLGVIKTNWGITTAGSASQTKKHPARSPRAQKILQKPARERERVGVRERVRVSERASERVRVVL